MTHSHLIGYLVNRPLLLSPYNLGALLSYLHPRTAHRFVSTHIGTFLSDARALCKSAVPHCLSSSPTTGSAPHTPFLSLPFLVLPLLTDRYKVNLTRMSVMWQALFDLSNPFLHFAKALHFARISQLDFIKWSLFNLFAATFFICRVVGGPVSILWPSFTIAAKVLPRSYCYTCWGLEIFVYVLQLLWFYKIVEIARKGDDKTD